MNVERKKILTFLCVFKASHKIILSVNIILLLGNVSFTGSSFDNRKITCLLLPCLSVPPPAGVPVQVSMLWTTENVLTIFYSSFSTQVDG